LDLGPGKFVSYRRCIRCGDVGQIVGQSAEKPAQGTAVSLGPVGDRVADRGGTMLQHSVKDVASVRGDGNPLSPCIIGVSRSLDHSLLLQ